MEMKMLEKSENFKQKTELKMFNNLVTNNSDLLICVEGCKDKQNITSVDLIKNCKLKKKILDRSWKEVEPEIMFKPQETIFELNRNRYFGDNRPKKNIGSGGHSQNKIPER